MKFPQQSESNLLSNLANLRKLLSATRLPRRTSQILAKHNRMKTPEWPRFNLLSLTMTSLLPSTFRQALRPAKIQPTKLLSSPRSTTPSPRNHLSSARSRFPTTTWGERERLDLLQAKPRPGLMLNSSSNWIQAQKINVLQLNRNLRALSLIMTMLLMHQLYKVALPLLTSKRSQATISIQV